MSGEKPELGYFRTTVVLGQKYEADDMYQGTRLACAEAINSGITFVHSWCHNIRSPEYAEADLRALLHLLVAGAAFAVANQLGNAGFGVFAGLVLVAGAVYAIIVIRHSVQHKA